MLDFQTFFFFTKKKLKLCSWLQIKGVLSHTFVADYFPFFPEVMQYFTKTTKKLFWSNLCTLHLPQSSSDIFKFYFTVKSCVYIMFFLYLFFLLMQYMKKCKKFQTCKCIIWTTKLQIFACFYLFMTTKIKNVVSQIYLQRGEKKIKIWVTLNVQR